jgi:hypothetical protein
MSGGLQNRSFVFSTKAAAESGNQAKQSQSQTVIRLFTAMLPTLQRAARRMFPADAERDQ